MMKMSSEEEMEKKVYQIQEKKLTQTELTLGQDKELIKLWKEAGLSAEKLKDIQDLNGIIDLLIERKILERFLFIILNGPKEEIDWDAIPNSVLFEVISDFLALNEKWIGKLRNFLNNFLSGESPK